MKILGMIVEYNPFHNGHKYHLKKSMEITGAEYSVAVMSGDFTQRGEIALLDKWSRSRLAVENGVDLVLELPFTFACNRGELFASGAVDILQGIGITDISFGSECGDIETLRELADAIISDSDRLIEIRKERMRSGVSFARAFHIAVEERLGKDKASLLTSPNNILAVEYLKRISYWRHTGHMIRAFTIKREGAGYREADDESGMAGASAIRDMIMTGAEGLGMLEKYMPEDVVQEILRCSDIQNAEKRAFLLLKGQLTRMSSDELSQIYCMGEGLENKFKKEIIKADSMAEFVSCLVSRRYTEAAVKRLIIYILTGLKKNYAEADMPVYARVLAAGKRGRQLLNIIKKNDIASIPVITNINRYKEISMPTEDILKYDILASDIYNIINGRNLYGFSDRVVRPYISQQLL